MALASAASGDLQYERGTPTFCHLSGLLDDRLSDVAVTVHAHYSKEDARTFNLHRVILSGKARRVDWCYLCVYSGFVRICR